MLLLLSDKPSKCEFRVVVVGIKIFDVRVSLRLENNFHEFGEIPPALVPIVAPELGLQAAREETPHHVIEFDKCNVDSIRKQLCESRFSDPAPPAIEILRIYVMRKD